MKKIMLSLVVSLIFVSCVSTSLYKPVSDNSKMYMYADDYQHTTFYRYELTNMPDFDITGSYFYSYIGKESNKKYFHLVLIYGSSKWIFFTRAILLNDKKETLTYNFNDFQMDRKVTQSGLVLEQIDFTINREKIQQLQNFLSISSIINIRLSGQDIDEFEISNEQRIGFIETIKFYNNL
jgi:hypothetical protein